MHLVYCLFLIVLHSPHRTLTDRDLVEEVGRLGQDLEEALPYLEGAYRGAYREEVPPLVGLPLAVLPSAVPPLVVLPLEVRP